MFFLSNSAVCSFVIKEEHRKKQIEPLQRMTNTTNKIIITTLISSLIIKLYLINIKLDTSKTHFVADKIPSLNNSSRFDDIISNSINSKITKEALSSCADLKIRASSVIKKCQIQRGLSSISTLHSANIKKYITWEMIVEPKPFGLLGCVPLRASSSTWNYRLN